MSITRYTLKTSTILKSGKDHPITKLVPDPNGEYVHIADFLHILSMYEELRQILDSHTKTLGQILKS